MQELASRVHPAASWRHAGDLAWAAALAGETAACPTAVWREGGRVVAWGWLEGPGELTLQVDPAHAAVAALADEVLEWAEGASGVGGASNGVIGTTISERETHIAAALRGRGYTAAAEGPFFAHLGHDLRDLPPIPALPEGYRMMQCGDGDVATRAAAHRAAWSYWKSAYSERQHTALRALWPYKSEFDLMAIAPDGTPAAYHQGWYDESSRVGLFEPVGTHPEHRRLGLSRALGTAVMHAFAAAGARMAVVNPRGDEAYTVARLTYEALGFEGFGRTYTYTNAP
jgi:GNAT superfamily N-acetyltransferase